MNLSGDNPFRPAPHGHRRPGGRNDNPADTLACCGVDLDEYFARIQAALQFLCTAARADEPLSSSTTVPFLHMLQDMTYAAQERYEAWIDSALEPNAPPGSDERQP